MDFPHAFLAPGSTHVGLTHDRPRRCRPACSLPAPAQAAGTDVVGRGPGAATAPRPPQATTPAPTSPTTAVAGRARRAVEPRPRRTQRRSSPSCPRPSTSDFRMVGVTWSRRPDDGRHGRGAHPHGRHVVGAGRRSTSRCSRRGRPARHRAAVGRRRATASPRGSQRRTGTLQGVRIATIDPGSRRTPAPARHGRAADDRAAAASTAAARSLTTVGHDRRHARRTRRSPRSSPARSGAPAPGTPCDTPVPPATARAASSCTTRPAPTRTRRPSRPRSCALRRRTT